MMLTYVSACCQSYLSLFQETSRQPMQIVLNRPFFKKVIEGYLMSIGVYSIAYIPVIVFTFIGLSQTPYLVETNRTLNAFMQTHVLSVWVLFRYLSSVLIVVPVLGAGHVIYIRPVVFSIYKELELASRVVTALTVLL